MYKVLLGIASVVIIIAGIKVSSSIVGPIFFALTLTFLFTPILLWLKKVGLPAWLALLVMTLGVFLMLGIVIFIISSSTQQLIENLPTYQEELQKQLAPIQDAIASLIKQWNIPTTTAVPKDLQNGSTLIAGIFSFFSGIVASSTSLGFFLFTLLLMLISSEAVMEKFKKSFKQNNHFAVQIAVWSTNIQKQYLIQTMSNFVSGIVLTIVFLVLKIDFALLWGMLAFFFAYIPNFGLLISSIPPILFAFIQYGPQTALITIFAIIILNILMDNVITPRFMGKGLEVPAVVVFLSFLFWTYIFGFLGAFLALPITLAIRGILQENKKTKFVADLLTR